jgi:hypothetical protein
MAPFLAPVDDLHPRHVEDLAWLILCLLLLLMLGTQRLRGSGSCLHVIQTSCKACKNPLGIFNLLFMKRTCGHTNTFFHNDASSTCCLACVDFWNYYFYYYYY